jgi:hypothetical protein
MQRGKERRWGKTISLSHCRPPAQKGAGQQLCLRRTDAAGPAELGEGLARRLLQGRWATACCLWPVRSGSPCATGGRGGRRHRWRLLRNAIETGEFPAPLFSRCLRQGRLGYSRTVGARGGCRLRWRSLATGEELDDARCRREERAPRRPVVGISVRFEGSFAKLPHLT